MSAAPPWSSFIERLNFSGGPVRSRHLRGAVRAPGGAEYQNNGAFSKRMENAPLFYISEGRKPDRFRRKLYIAPAASGARLSSSMRCSTGRLSARFLWGTRPSNDRAEAKRCREDAAVRQAFGFRRACGCVCAGCLAYAWKRQIFVFRPCIASCRRVNRTAKIASGVGKPLAMTCPCGGQRCCGRECCVLRVHSAGGPAIARPN